MGSTFMDKYIYINGGYIERLVFRRFGKTTHATKNKIICQFFIFSTKKQQIQNRQLSRGRGGEGKKRIAQQILLIQITISIIKRSKTNGFSFDYRKINDKHLHNLQNETQN